MKWIQALKEWNSKTNKGKWCIPRKGSSEYDDVKKIMNKGSPPRVKKGNVMNYVRKFRESTKKEQPNLTEKEVNRLLLTKWKTLSDKEQLLYV